MPEPVVVEKFREAALRCSETMHNRGDHEPITVTPEEWREILEWDRSVLSEMKVFGIRVHIHHESPDPCPECGVHNWWAEYRTPNMKYIVYFSGGIESVVAFRYCNECGHTQAEGMEPDPNWPEDVTFPFRDTRTP